MSYILVIDDSETNNILLQSTLEVEGYTVKTALSAQIGWGMIHDSKPRLILLDLLMPKVSGFQLLNKIKQNQNFKDIPVVIVSAVNDQETVKSLLEKGAIDYFSKPIDISTIIDRVNDLMK